MTPQLTIPPAYMWNRIEKILDEQESEKKFKQKEVSYPFRQSVKNQPLNYFFAVTGAGILALIMLNYSPVLKDS